MREPFRNYIPVRKSSRERTHYLEVLERQGKTIREDSGECCRRSLFQKEGSMRGEDPD